VPEVLLGGIAAVVSGLGVWGAQSVSLTHRKEMCWRLLCGKEAVTSLGTCKEHLEEMKGWS
jgi:hypothetical protein